MILWTAFYLAEKVIICYITLHYHYRRSDSVLEQTRDVHRALDTLYQYSVKCYPMHDPNFRDDDLIIRNSKGDLDPSSRIRVSSYFSRLGIDGYKIMTAVWGNTISDDSHSHWLRPGSAHAIIERAWTNPIGASAVARRVWLPLVPSGGTVLRERDIVTALGRERRAEALRLWQAIDVDNTGELQLSDFEGLVTQTGKTHHHIYKTFANLDHCLNTLDWLMLGIIAVVMIYFIG